MKVLRYGNILYETKKYHIYPHIWQWILANFVTADEVTWSDQNLVQNTDAEKTVDMT